MFIVSCKGESVNSPHVQIRVWEVNRDNLGILSGFIRPKYLNEFILPNQNPKISKNFCITPLKPKLKEKLVLEI